MIVTPKDKNNGVWIKIELHTRYQSKPILSEETESQFFEFKMNSISNQGKLYIMTVQFDAGDDEIMELAIRENQLENTMTVKLSGCWTKIIAIGNSNRRKEKETIYTFDFPLKPLKDGQSGNIIISKDRIPFLSLPNNECEETSQGPMWFNSAGWYSGYLTFPNKQEVHHIKMMQSDDPGKLVVVLNSGF